eukprot:g10869.t1
MGSMLFASDLTMELHAGCRWDMVQPPSGSTEVWHIFRAADGLSWVIDSEAARPDLRPFKRAYPVCLSNG